MSIEIKKLSKVFEGETKALNNVNISFQKNKITGLIGFNGSGKTTTFNILANFIEEHEGEFSFDGKKLDLEVMRKISYLASGAEPKNPMKVINHLKQIANLYNVPKSEAIEKIEKIAEKIDFVQFLNKPIKSLSKGNQQKIKVISSLLNPKLEYLFLDEPFEGLDPIMVKRISEIYKSLKGVTIIITSHRMNVINDLCEEFYVLREGKLIDSRKVDQTKINVETNKEIKVTEIKKLKYVTEVQKSEDKIFIEIDSIDNFKKLNKELLKQKDFIYCSIKEKDLAASVFEGYGEK